MPGSVASGTLCIKTKYLLAPSVRGTIFPRKYVQVEITYEDGRDTEVFIDAYQLLYWVGGTRTVYRL